MTAANYNFTVDAGSKFSRIFRCKDSAGVAIDITGASIAMMARTSYSSVDAVLSLSTADGTITLSNPTNGEFTITIAAATTTALGYTLPTKLVYDIERTLSGVVIRLLYGTVTITPEATR